MLKEVETVKQQPDEDFRRWFRDEYFDLYVWTNPSGTITGFQLCYDKPGKERAITWLSDKGSFHHRIDPGDQNPVKNRTPILVQDGLFQGDIIERRFAESSKAIEANLAAFVRQKLRECQAPLQAAGSTPGTGVTSPIVMTVPGGADSRKGERESGVSSLAMRSIGAPQQPRSAEYYWGTVLVLVGVFGTPFFGTYSLKWGIGWSHLCIAMCFVLGLVGWVLRVRVFGVGRTGARRFMHYLGSVASLTFLSGVAILTWSAVAYFQVMASKERMSEGKFGLSVLHSAVKEFAKIHDTYAVPDRSQLKVAGPGGNPFQPGRYSFWYSVNAIPTSVPGSARATGPCDLTTPPSSVKVTASGKGFVAAAKGDVDGDATCDEWSINEKGELTHTLDDLND